MSINLKNCFSSHNVSLWFQVRSIVTVSRAYKSVSAYYMYSTMKGVFEVRPPVLLEPVVRHSSATISRRVSLFLFEISFAAARISLS